MGDKCRQWDLSACSDTGFSYFFLKQGDVLKLHVTTKYLSWRKGRLWNVWKMAGKKRRSIWFPLGPCCIIGEITHCQSMKGSFPRDCLISSYLHLLAKHSHGRADAEVRGHTGRSLINHWWVLFGDYPCNMVFCLLCLCRPTWNLFSESHGYSVS